MVQVPGQGSPQRDACSVVEGKHCTDRSAKTLKDKCRYEARSSLQQGIVILKGPSFVYRFQLLSTRGIKDGPLRRRNIQGSKEATHTTPDKYAKNSLARDLSPVGYLGSERTEFQADFNCLRVQVSRGTLALKGPRFKADFNCLRVQVSKTVP